VADPWCSFIFSSPRVSKVLGEIHTEAFNCFPADTERSALKKATGRDKERERKKDRTTRRRNERDGDKRDKLENAHSNVSALFLKM
jgi:hypothetical protein